ncbi:hypothetical protein D3C72_1011860 [compost metagenome]
MQAGSGPAGVEQDPWLFLCLVVLPYHLTFLRTAAEPDLVVLDTRYEQAGTVVDEFAYIRRTFPLHERLDQILPWPQA